MNITSNTAKKIILDRDGVINQDSLAYIKSPAEMILLPGSAQAIARLCRAGYKVAIATNQSGIARGYYTESQLREIHDKMLSEIHIMGGCIDLIKYCPHLPNTCSCRKPESGMFEAIARDWGCSLVDVPFVGDRLSDIQVAYKVGMIPYLVLSNMTDYEGLKQYPDVSVFSSLDECVTSLLEM